MIKSKMKKEPINGGSFKKSAGLDTVDTPFYFPLFPRRCCAGR